MQRAAYRFSFLSLLIVFSYNLSAQITPREIDSIVLKAMKQFNVAGIAVAIVKDGKLYYEKGYGVQSVDTKTPVTPNTNFQIASNSKAFTTAALSILVDEGKIGWQDRVRQYLPEFKMYNDYVTENFTIEDLLCHRSGLGLGAGDLQDFPDGANFTIQDKLKLFENFKPESALRTKFDYDNQLYTIAGELIARVSGMTWEQFIQSRILDPLQMNNSFASPNMIKDRSTYSSPHSTVNSPLRTIPNFLDMLNGAAGGIVSNVHDMSKWALLQLNRGKYGDSLKKILFTPDRQREMWSIHTTLPSNNEPRYNRHFAGYGLGWFLQDIKGNLMVSHTGGLPGMLTSFTLIPDLKLGIIVLTNTEPGGGAAFSAINRTIQDRYFGLPDMDWIGQFYKGFSAGQNEADSIVKKVWQTVETNKKTKVDVNNYIGVYEDKWFGKMEVFMKGNQLWMKSHRSPKLNGAMYFYKANTFAVKWEYQDMPADAFAMFSLDEEGKATGIKMKGISPDIDFSFDFQDLDLQRVTK